MKAKFVAANPALIAYVAAAIGAILFVIYLFHKFGAGAADPGGGAASTGVLDGILNQTLEIGRSPENYTAAAQQTVIHPVDTLASILGISTAKPIPMPPTTNPAATSNPAIDIAAQTGYGYEWVTP